MSKSKMYEIPLNLSLVMDYKWAKMWSSFADILFATMNFLVDRRPIPTITWKHTTSNTWSYEIKFACIISEI
jgi:hypothetical protein